MKNILKNSKFKCFSVAILLLVAYGIIDIMPKHKGKSTVVPSAKAAPIRAGKSLALTDPNQ